ncbi:SR-related and CTD-associated factor 4-like [Engraulis encrasicolus]|uniref:SR-related and CTD-associated factor 4-like n=1 Tax=Engraulis encrasicolus TaxID=184585 RepID=UPI002FD5C92C
MDAVNAFNTELFSMIDMKPPISRAKMMSITKSAIKAIKLYKHVVQIVEKFIKKCKPELKVPGLYVVDSIVRQSRHQFGIDKDMFAPRFLKNFTATFQNLYMCPPDDKSKILRVLNLWQKNGVFTMDIIQPLLDMATGNAVAPPVVENGLPDAASPPAAVPAEAALPVTSASIVQALPQLQNSGALAAVAQLFQSSQGQELHHILQNLHPSQASAVQGGAGPVAAGPAMMMPSGHPLPHSSLPPPVMGQQQPPSTMPMTVPVTMPGQPMPFAMAGHQPMPVPVTMAGQPMTVPVTIPGHPMGVPVTMAGQPMTVPVTMPGQPMTFPVTMSGQPMTVPVTMPGQHMTVPVSVPGHTNPPTEQKNSFAKKLLARFDYDDEPEPAEEVKEELPPAMPPNVPLNMQQPIMYPQFAGQMANQPGMMLMQGMGQPMMSQQMTGVPGVVPGIPGVTGVVPGAVPGVVPGVSGVVPVVTGVAPGVPGAAHFMPQMQIQIQAQPGGSPAAPQQPQMAEVEAEPSSGRRERRDDTRSRRSRSRSPRRHSPSRSRRSRSGSRERSSRRSRFHRSRSRSRERRSDRRDNRSQRSRSEERKEREKERERRQKGLPPIKSKTLSVCSTTLWVGQLDKKTTQQDITQLLEEFGQIESINMIPPRGCAYIVMVHRQDAFRALTSLSRGTTKVNQKAIKIAWALNKGIKPELKKLWDVERGVTYIPWEKVKVASLEGYREGGMLDAETLCPDWNSSVKELTKPAGAAAEAAAAAAAAAASMGSPDGRKPEDKPVSTAQVAPTQPMTAPSVGKPGFPPPMGIPPLAMMPGRPLPPFLPPGFDPTKLPPGFLPPGALSAVVPPPTGAAMSMPPVTASPVKPATAKEPVKDKDKDKEEDKKAADKPPSSEAPSSEAAAAPGATPPAGGPESMSPPPALAGLLGTRPGIMPLQRPPHPGLASPPGGPPGGPPGPPGPGGPPGPMPPFMPPFPPDMMPPNMFPPMMPRGPNPMMFRGEAPPGRFRMPMPPRGDFRPPPMDDFPSPMEDFMPPHGPPRMGPPPEGMDDWDGPPPPPLFGNDWHRDGPPGPGPGWFRDGPPHRGGRGGRGWGRDRPGPGPGGPPGRFMNRRESFD